MGRLVTRRGGNGRSLGALPVWLAVGGLLAIVITFMNVGLIDIDFPDWFGGGKSDPNPLGAVIYEGQTARSASERFMVDIGNGEAVVSVRAKQDHDKPGNVFSGDFQSTNGTSSVADPEDGDLPATLRIRVDYCASGVITAERAPGGEGGEPVTDITFDMRELFVCNTTLEHTVANDAAFKQDDTPNDFHGRFVNFVASAAETVAAAAACPTEELERFGEEELTSYMEAQLAEQFGVPEGRVEVVPGRPGQTAPATRQELRHRLESYASRRDPDHPSRTFEALSIEYLSGDAEAVADSCYRDPGSRRLDTLEDVEPPRVDR